MGKIENWLVRFFAYVFFFGGLAWAIYLLDKSTYSEFDINLLKRVTRVSLHWPIQMSAAISASGLGILLFLVSAILERLDRLIEQGDEMLIGLPVWPGPKPAPRGDNPPTDQ